jgi:hypothetical protein
MLSGREAVRTAVKHVSREGGLDTVTTGLLRESSQNTTQNASTMPLAPPAPIVLPALGEAWKDLVGGLIETLAAPLIILDYLISPGTTATEDKDTIHAPAESRSNPFTGNPGDTSTVRHPDGTTGQTRRYGPDGYPETDVDRGHDHTGAGDPHAHDWGRPSNGAPPTHEDRKPPRPVQPGDPQPN